MRAIKQNNAYTLMVLMVSDTDHITGLAGLTLAVSMSKAGAAFSTITPTIVDRGNGWYAIALTASDTNTLGDLALRVTAATADPSDVLVSVVAGSLDADVSSRLPTSSYAAPDNAGITAINGKLPAALVGGRMDSSVGAMATDVITAAALSAGAVTEIQSGLALSTQVDALEGDTTTLLARLTSTRAALLDNLTLLDVAISTRLAAAGYTAPPSAADIWNNGTRTLTSGGAGGLTPAESARLLLIEQLLRNKFITDPSTGIATLYADDGTTVLLTCQLYENAAGSQTYRGQGAERRERFT